METTRISGRKGKIYGMTGELATSKAGHDKDRLYLVIREDDENVYLCDGRLRGVTNPKKKKKKHIQIIHFSVPAEVLQRAEKVTPETESGINEEIRKLLEEYLKKKAASGSNKGKSK